MTAQCDLIVQEITKKIDDSNATLTTRVNTLEHEKLATNAKITGLENDNRELLEEDYTPVETSLTEQQKENDSIKMKLYC